MVIATAYHPPALGDGRYRIAGRRVVGPYGGARYPLPFNYP